jgi:GTP cyclohydrolase I
LSKLNRIVEFFSKRPQVQERLTEQIAAAIAFVAETPDVAVYLEAVHFCVKSRGIQDTGSSTCTLAVDGSFAEVNSDIRREFLNIARGLSILN